MKRVFADSYYFFALLNTNEPRHVQARAFAESYHGELVTTEWILVELADGLAKPKWRSTFVAIYDELSASPHVQIVTGSHELLRAGLQLYRARHDKAWSLTDCTSFVVMEQEGITEALTGDQHFEQAGFTALLK
jgi:uncharacterized protein